MGGHTFQQAVGGKKMTANEAYQTLVEQAELNYGCDTYNGTISTTRGFVMVDKGKQRLDTAVRRILEDESSEIQKWGPAGCIELSGSQLRRWKRQHGLERTRARAYLFFGWAAS